MTVRLPIPGQDDGTWGNLLNDFLDVEHNANGTLKIRDDGTLAPVATSGSYADLTDKPSFNQSVLQADVVSAQAGIGVYSGLPGVVDGVTVSDSQIILLTAEASGVNNGLWVVHSATPWTRPSGFTGGADASGLVVVVRGGNTGTGTIWVVQGASPRTIDTNSTAWVQYRNTNDRGLVNPYSVYYTGDIVTIGNLRVIITKGCQAGSTGSISAANYAIVSYLSLFDIRSYGAKVDGNTDDTVAIQKAISAASTTTGAGFGGGGGIVYFPPGWTTISSTLYLPSNVHLLGAGHVSSWIQLRAGSNCHMVAFKPASNAYSDATLPALGTTITFAAGHNIADGSSIFGPGIPAQTTVVSGGGSSTTGITVSNVVTSSAGSTAGVATVYVGATSGSNAYYSSVRNLNLDGRKMNQGIIFSDATVTSGSTTVTFGSSHDIASGSYVVGNGIAPGTTVATGGTGVTSITLSQVANNAATTPGSTILQFGGPYNGIVLETFPYSTGASGDGQFDPTHRIDNVRLYTIHSNAIHLYGRSDCIVSNCKVSFCGGTAYRSSFDTHFIGCASEASGGHGLEIQNSSVQVTNCKFYNGGKGTAIGNPTGTTTPGNGYGIYLHNTSVGEITITNTDVQQWNGTGIRLDSVQASILTGITVAQAGFNDNTGLVASGGSYAAIEVAGSAKSNIIQAAIENGTNGLRLSDTVTHNDIHITNLSTVSGAVDISSDSMTLIGSGNTVVVNGATLTATLSLLKDVSISSPSSGQYLSYNGSSWVNAAAPGIFYGNVFGDGSDGAITLDGTATVSGIAKSGSVYTLGKDLNATALTVASGVTLNMNGWKILCRGAVTNNGIVNAIGNAASGSTAGLVTNQGSLGGGAPGGAGNTGSGSAGTAGGVGVGSGGAGGAGSTGTAGTAGNSLNITTSMLRNPQPFLTGTISLYGTPYALKGGGGGGSGGGDGTNKGGGGGSGGGLIAIIASTVVNTGTMSVAGGAGGNATAGNCGGGGGGGGGLIIALTQSAWTNSGTTTVSGGSAGTGLGTGASGTAGATGYAVNYVMQ